MRILVTCNSRVPPHDAVASGMTKSAFELIQGLARGCMDARLDVTVLAHRATRLPDGVRLLETRGASIAANGVGKGRSALAHASLGDYDVVLDHSDTSTVAIASARAGTPCIRTIRLSVDHPSNAEASRYVRGAVHLSQDHRSRDHRHPPRTTTVIRDAIPVRLDPESAQRRARRAISIGRIEPEKGHDIAARVAGALGLPLLAVGPVTDPSYAGRLADLPGVQVLSPASRKQVLHLLHGSARLIWTPRLVEPGGRVVIEALRLGVPVVGRRIGFLCDLAHETGGLDVEHAGERLVEVSRLPDTWPQSPVDTARLYLDLVRAIV